MRIVQSIILVLVASLCHVSVAQRISRVSSGADINFGLQESAWSPSIRYHQALNPANAKWLQFQWGLKGWGFSDKSADLSSKGNLLQSDSLIMGKVNHFGVSFTVGLGVKFGQFEAGAMTDLVSLAFGGTKKGLYQLTSYTNANLDAIEYHNNLIEARPTFASALPLAFKGQNGQTEIYVRYRISNQFAVKAGYLIGQQSYSTDVKLNDGQSRFSGTYQMPFIGVSFPMFN